MMGTITADQARVLALGYLDTLYKKTAVSIRDMPILMWGMRSFTIMQMKAQVQNRTVIGNEYAGSVATTLGYLVR